ncbi:unnamed protein product [Lymnaea stagnalis]|uniref:L-Fucosyltransferase n=1 Tax=Lymnaea stagnalis TaxID=6523 RepID=A0AAV2HLA9_LYMST
MALTSSTNRLDYQPKTNKLFARYKYLMLAATFIVCALLQARLSDKVFFPMRFAFLDEAVHNASILSSNVTQPGRRSEFRDGNTQTAVTGKVSESERGNGLVGDKQTSESNNAFQNLSHKVDLPASGNVNQSVIFDKAASKPNVVTDLVVRHEKVPGSNISQSGNFSDQRNSKEGVLGAGISETNIPGNLSTNQSVVLADNISRATPLFITITHQMGRMGNNMFEYASLLGIARAQGRHPFVNPYGRDHNLPHVFNLTHVEFIPECGKWKRIGELKYGTFDPVFRDLPKVNLTLMGYVQSWKYFRGIEDEIRREFTFMPHIRLQADTIHYNIRKRLQNISDPVFVGVHVRMKDYSRSPYPEAPISFFRNAFSRMRELVPGKNLVFLLASNGIEWCRKNLQEPGVVVLEDAEREVHFAVLARCKHMIVSVGTFGWWAGWLTAGHVIYYVRFPNKGSRLALGLTMEDYYPPSWIAVDH